MDWFLYDNGLRHERVKASSCKSNSSEAAARLFFFKKAVTLRCNVKTFAGKFRIIHNKTTIIESFLGKLVDTTTILNCGCFLVNAVKFFRKGILQTTCELLLLFRKDIQENVFSYTTATAYKKLISLNPYFLTWLVF